jgi:hypothetical protein
VKLQVAWQEKTKKEGSVTKGGRGDCQRRRERGEEGENNIHLSSLEKPAKRWCRDLTGEVDCFKEKGKSFSLERSSYFI